MKKTKIALSILLSSLASINSFATTTTNAFGVSTAVAASCSISGVSNIGFSGYNPTLTSTGTGSISALCSKDTPYTLSLSAGVGTFANRAMSGPVTDKLNYNVFLDAGYTSIFGDGTSTTSSVSATGTGAVQAITVYGKIPSGQFINVGSYSETLTVSLVY
jgi:spore coat protein U-like protein